MVFLLSSPTCPATQIEYLGSWIVSVFPLLRGMHPSPSYSTFQWMLVWSGLLSGLNLRYALRILGGWKRSSRHSIGSNGIFSLSSFGIGQRSLALRERGLTLSLQGVGLFSKSGRSGRQITCSHYSLYFGLHEWFLPPVGNHMLAVIPSRGRSTLPWPTRQVLTAGLRLICLVCLHMCGRLAHPASFTFLIIVRMIYWARFPSGDWASRMRVRVNCEFSQSRMPWSRRCYVLPMSGV